MKLRQLRRRHPEYDGETIQTYGDLFRGGRDFHKNVKRYLLQNDVEPQTVYDKRCKASHYLNYCGPIGGYFASLLFSSPMTYISDPVEADQWWAEWKEDVDQLGTDLDSFFHRQFVEALVKKHTFWRVDFPKALGDEPNKAAWQESGAGEAVIVDVPTENIINWRKVEDRYLWLMEYSKLEELIRPGDDEPTTTETWTLWNADGPNQRWRAVYTKANRPKDDDIIPEVDAPKTMLAGIPFVELCMPPELWLMNLLADGQLEHFRQRCALSWSIQRTCYAMPVFTLKDKRKPPANGIGYYIMLGEGETLTYAAPPSAPYDTIQAYNQTLKDELHRVAQQMARGVENNAAAVGRSGMSKQADEHGTEVVLKAFGRLVREAVERTMNLIAEGRGGDVKWSISGMDAYRLADAKTIADTALVSDAIKVPSPTYRREMMKRVAYSQLPDLDQETKQAIAEEIEAGVNAEDLYPEPPPMVPIPPDEEDENQPPNEGEAPAKGKPQGNDK